MAFVSRYRAARGCINDAVGVMMWKGQWVEHCKTAACGFKGETEAEALWTGMKAEWEKNRDAFIWDLKSPVATEPLRLRIVEKDLSIARN
eukprot:10092559-Alexandrium_andersonii.AAC.1